MLPRLRFGLVWIILPRLRVGLVGVIHRRCIRVALASRQCPAALKKNTGKMPVPPTRDGRIPTPLPFLPPPASSLPPLISHLCTPAFVLACRWPRRRRWPIMPHADAPHLELYDPAGRSAGAGSRGRVVPTVQPQRGRGRRRAAGKPAVGRHRTGPLVRQRSGAGRARGAGVSRRATALGGARRWPTPSSGLGAGAFWRSGNCRSYDRSAGRAARAARRAAGRDVAGRGAVERGGLAIAGRDLRAVGRAGLAADRAGGGLAALDAVGAVWLAGAGAARPGPGRGGRGDHRPGPCRRSASSSGCSSIPAAGGKRSTRAWRS